MNLEPVRGNGTEGLGQRYVMVGTLLHDSQDRADLTIEQDV